MDNKEAGKEVSEEATRESLISISHSAPARKEAAVSGFDGQNVVKGVDGDGDGKYRSKLISISYSHSPDAKV